MLLNVFLDIVRITILPVILGILILLITFLVVKDTNKRAKIGLIAGALLIILDFVFIFGYFYNNSNPWGALLNLIGSGEGIAGGSGMGLFLMIGPILFAWSYFILKGKKDIADIFDQEKLN